MFAVHPSGTISQNGNFKDLDLSEVQWNVLTSPERSIGPIWQDDGSAPWSLSKLITPTPNHKLAKIWDKISQPLYQQKGVDFYFQGKNREAREVYSKLIETDPKNKILRQLRVENNYAWYEDFKSLSADRAQEILRELALDQAALIALEKPQQKRQLLKLFKDSRSLLDAPLEVQEEFISQIQELGSYYAKWAMFPILSYDDNSWISSEIRKLGASVFTSLASFSSESSISDIRKKADYFQAQAHLLQEDYSGARFHLKKAEHLAEARELLQKLEDHQTRLNNLAVLSIWRHYNEEKFFVESEQLASPLGKIFSTLEDWVGKKDTSMGEELSQSLQRENEFIILLQDQLTRGQANTISQALKLLSEDASSPFSKMASEWLMKTQAGSRRFSDSSNLIPRLIQYVSDPEAQSHLEPILFEKAFQLASEFEVGKTVLGVYLLLKNLSQDEQVTENVQRNLSVLSKEKGFVDYLGQIVAATDLDSLALQVTLLAASAGMANNLTLKAMTKMGSAGLTGAKGAALAHGINVWAEGTALWTFNTAYLGLTHRPEEIFQKEAMINSYAATLLMIGGIKTLARAGGEAGFAMARKTGLRNALGEGFNPMGQALAGISRNTFGLGGMVLSTQVSQGFGFLPNPEGGLPQSLAHDVVGYFRFAIAHRLLDRFSQGAIGRMSATSATALKLAEAKLRSEAVLSQMQLAPMGRSKQGSPIYSNPLVQKFFEGLSFATAFRPGFHPENLPSLVNNGQTQQAQAYARNFGLHLNFEGGKPSEFRELTLHEKLAHQGRNSTVSYGVGNAWAARAWGWGGGLAALLTPKLAEAAIKIEASSGMDPSTSKALGLGIFLGTFGGLAAVIKGRTPSESKENLLRELNDLEQKLENTFPNVEESLAITEQLRQLDQRVFKIQDPELNKIFHGILENKLFKSLTTRDIKSLIEELPKISEESLRVWTHTLFILNMVRESHYSNVVKSSAKEALKGLLENISAEEVKFLVTKLGEDPIHHGGHLWAFLDTIRTDHPNSHTRGVAKIKLDFLAKSRGFRYP